jgi:plasmid segregation protein ParM
MSNAYAIIAEHLRNQYRIFKENYELDEIIQKAQIKVAGKVYSLEQVKKDAYEQVSAKILTEMNSIWDRRDLDAILISGGGGKALADYILPELETAALVDDSQVANVNGYLKLGHKVFGFTENRPKFSGPEPTVTPNHENRFAGSKFFDEKQDDKAVRK